MSRRSRDSNINGKKFGSSWSWFGKVRGREVHANVGGTFA